MQPKAIELYRINLLKQVLSNHFFDLLDLLIITNTITIVSVISIGLFLEFNYQNSPSICSVIVLTVFIWQVYTVDRLLPHPEDRTIKTNKLHPTNFVKQHRSLILFLFIASFLIDLLCILLDRNLIFGLGIGFIVCAVYSFELPLLKKRIKSIPFVKNFYVAFFKVILPYFMTETSSEITRHPYTFITLYIIIFVSEIMLDLKDRDSDYIAGIKTFANVLSLSAIVTTSILLTLSVAVISYLLERDAIHLVLASSLAATAASLVPIYYKVATRYITSVIELTAALPLIFWTILV